jgi:hypothetical protein
VNREGRTLPVISVVVLLILAVVSGLVALFGGIAFITNINDRSGQTEFLYAFAVVAAIAFLISSVSGYAAYKLAKPFLSKR